MNLSANAFLVRSRFHCSPCTLLGGQYFHQHLYTAPKLTCWDMVQTSTILRHVINTRQGSYHMRYRVINLSQQNANVLLRHLFCLPAGFLKNCLKQHSNMLSTEERQLFDFMVASKLLLGPLLMQPFHRKQGRFTRLKGLKLQVF